MPKNKEICGDCRNYSSTGKDIGTCDFKLEPVSRVRPSCDDFEPGEENEFEAMAVGQMTFPAKGDEANKKICLNCARYEMVDSNDAFGQCHEYKSGRAFPEPHEDACELYREKKAGAGDAEDKNVTGRVETVPDVIKPVEVEQAAFDYAELDADTAHFLQDRATAITEVRIRSIIAIGRELREAQNKLAKRGIEGCFSRWVESIGLKRSTAYDYIRAYEYVRNSDNQEEFETIQPSLLLEISKPSAPPELAQAVIDGDITKHKDYQEALRKLKEAEELAEERRKSAALLTSEIMSRKSTEQSLREKIDQAKAEAAKAERAQKEAERQRDQAKEKLNASHSAAAVNALTTEVNRLQEELSAKPIEVPAVEVREVVPKSIRDTWCETITDAISTIANLYADDIRMLIDGLKLNVPGYLDGGGFEREIGDAIAYLEKLHELLEEDPTDED